jgi:hypothetical protein
MCIQYIQALCQPNLISYNSCLSYNISERTAQKIPFPFYPIDDIETYLFDKPLFNNDSRISAYSALVAQQRVRMPQYQACY